MKSITFNISKNENLSTDEIATRHKTGLHGCV